MSTGSTDIKDTKRFELESALAPHVDPRWAEQLLIELRLRGVSGEHIGDALAEVDAHVVDSGTGAAAAFGDPVAYAAALDLPVDTSEKLSNYLPILLLTLGNTAAMLVTTQAVAAIIKNEPQAISLGGVLLFGTLTAALLILVVLRSQTLRLALRHPLFLVGGIATVVAGGALLQLLVPDRAITNLPPIPLLVGGAMVLLALVPVSYRQLRGLADPVVPPLFDGSPKATDPRSGAWLYALSFPVATLLLSGLIVLFG
ncbi:MAG: hypothetical protein LBH11_04300 [Propionibacteriaceae bacterium]|nr:hypothetical protein [Propionibacteriaceae bacterium]